MVSLTAHLLQLRHEEDATREPVGRPPTVSPDPSPPLPPFPYPADNEVLSLGHYLVDLNHREGEHYLTLDLRTQQRLHCKIYPANTFHSLAPLVFSEIDGVHRVQDVTTLDDQVYVFSMRPAGGDLHNYLKQRRRLREGQAAVIFKQIVQLVADAHSKRVVLRDLKLKKFIFEDEEKTRLRLHTLDDAHYHVGCDTLTDRHGCPAYICPEMLQPGSYSGEAADLWSLGIILYTLLVGHYPFFDTNPQTLFTKIRSGYYPMPENITRLGRSLISSLLAYDPSRRVPAEVILDHPWFERATDDPSFSPPLTDQTVPRSHKKAKFC